MNYSKAISKFRPGIPEAALELRKKIWKEGENTEAAMDAFFDKVSELYDTPKPDVAYLEGGHDFDENYCGTDVDNENNMIRFTKPSLVGVLYACRKYLQSWGKASYMYRDDPEHDAKGWAMSLFSLIDPTGFRRAVAAGRIKPIVADPQLASDEDDGAVDPGEVVDLAGAPETVEPSEGSDAMDPAEVVDREA